MNSEQFLNWIILNPEYAGVAMFLIGFLEAFFISGAVWPSIILLLFAVGLSEAEINLAYICIGAGSGEGQAGASGAINFPPMPYKNDTVWTVRS